MILFVQSPLHGHLIRPAILCGVWPGADKWIHLLIQPVVESGHGGMTMEVRIPLEFTEFFIQI